MNIIKQLLTRIGMCELKKELNHMDEWDFELTCFYGKDWHTVSNMFPEAVVAPPFFKDRNMVYLEYDGEFGFVAFIFENGICFDAGIFYNKEDPNSPTLFCQYMQAKGVKLS